MYVRDTPVRALSVKVAQIYQRTLCFLQKLCIKLAGYIERTAAGRECINGAQLTTKQGKQREACRCSR